MNDSLIKEIKEDLHRHQIADESFQNAQQIHNLEMKAAQKETTEAITVMTEKIDQWLKVAASLSLSGKILLKILGGCVAIAAGIAAIKYILLGLLK